MIVDESRKTLSNFNSRQHRSRSRLALEFAYFRDGGIMHVDVSRAKYILSVPGTCTEALQQARSYKALSLWVLSDRAGAPTVSFGAVLFRARVNISVTRSVQSFVSWKRTQARLRIKVYRELDPLKS